MTRKVVDMFCGTQQRTLVRDIGHRKSYWVTARMESDLEDKDAIFPELLFNFKNVEELRLDFMRLTSLPSQFSSHFPKIRILNLSTNRLDQLPNDIGLIRSLEMLIVKENNIQFLPQSTIKLRKLERLDVHQNLIKSLPENLFEDMKNLVEVNLSQNFIHSIPAGLSNSADTLEIIKLSTNNIYELPKDLDRCSRVREFRIENNKLQNLPHIGSMNCLELLNVDDNYVNQLPESIGQLKYLRELSIQENYLVSLPAQFGHLLSLRILNLSFNSLISLPRDFSQLRMLEYFDVSYNQLRKLPASIGNLKNLSKFKLFRNSLTSLPGEFENLCCLKNLEISYNKLVSLPENFGNLRQITDISLSHNKLSSLPKSFGSLERLARVVLNHNEFEIIPNPLLHLPNLSFLGLHENRIKNIPKILLKKAEDEKLKICWEENPLSIVSMKQDFKLRSEKSDNATISIKCPETHRGGRRVMVRLMKAGEHRVKFPRLVRSGEFVSVKVNQNGHLGSDFYLGLIYCLSNLSIVFFSLRRLEGGKVLLLLSVMCFQTVEGLF